VPNAEGDKERQINYYHQDILGSTVMVTDGRGKVKESYSYDAYGNIYGNFPYISMGHGKPGLSRYLYNGKPYEPAVGLYNYGFRDYKSMLGRWTTVDPIHAGVNWYVYVNNNPVNWIDPLGLEGYLYLYSGEISSPGEKWEYTFREGAYAEAVKNKHRPDEVVEFEKVSTRGEFKRAIESFYKRHGIIEGLTVYSHMFPRGINLGPKELGRERFLRKSDLGSIQAEIERIKLAGCRAAEKVAGRENIAQSFANKFKAPVTASEVGTWFVGQQGVYDVETHRQLLTLEPRGGEWLTIGPSKKGETGYRRLIDCRE